MAKKFVVSIMDRHYLGDGNYLFSCSHTDIGEIDEKTHIFKGRAGDEFYPMLSPKSLETRVPHAYSNVTELNKLSYFVGPELSLKESVHEFDFLCKKVAYLVGKTDDDKVFCVTFNMDTLKHNAEAAMYPQKKEEEEEEEMDPELSQLIRDAVNGKYSLEQLKEIVENLKVNQEDLTEAIDTIELQIEASEKGESLTTLVGEKKKEEEEEKKAIKEAALKQKEEKENQRFMDIEDIFKKVTKTLIAQDEPARRVIAEIARKEMDERKQKQGILLTGQTGVGKTELMKLIAKYLNKPFLKVDATQITIPGYVGKDIEEVLWDLYIQCGKDIEKTEKAIIFFDEIDKKGSDKKIDNYFVEMELSLNESLGRKVKVDYGKNKGALILEFYDKEDLAELARKLAKEE